VLLRPEVLAGILYRGPGSAAICTRRAFPGKILALAKSTVKRVLTLATVYNTLSEAYERLAPQIMPVVHKLHGLLPPEHFWLAFDERDAAAMRKEFDKAFGPSSKSVVARYSAHSEAEKLRVAEAYRQIASLTARASRPAARKSLE
jgi:hypothetical protein